MVPDINTRFRQVRKECKKTQEEFGEILGITREGVASIEAGRRNVTEKHIKLLCVESISGKYVDEEWLRTGEGEMFRKLPEETSLDDFAKAHNATEADYQFIHNYLSLSPAIRLQILSLFSNKSSE